MEEIIFGIVIILMVLAGAAVYFGIVNIKVNNQDVKETAVNTSAAVISDACSVCAKQCGFNYTK